MCLPFIDLLIHYCQCFGVNKWEEAKFWWESKWCPNFVDWTLKTRCFPLREANYHTRTPTVCQNMILLHKNLFALGFLQETRSASWTNILDLALRIDCRNIPEVSQIIRWVGFTTGLTSKPSVVGWKLVSYPCKEVQWISDQSDCNQQNINLIFKMYFHLCWCMFLRPFLKHQRYHRWTKSFYWLWV